VDGERVPQHGVVAAVRIFDVVLLDAFAPGASLSKPRRGTIAVPVIEEQATAVGDMLVHEEVIQHLGGRAVEITVEMPMAKRVSDAIPASVVL
jgi:hypothetical protein